MTTLSKFAAPILLLIAFASPALAEDAKMGYPIGVAVAPDGTIYVADKNADRPAVWKIKDGKAEIFFEGSKRFRTPLNRVYCVAIDDEGRLLAGDSATREVYRFSADAKPEPLTHGFIGIPVALAVAADGTIYVADLEAQRIWSVPKDGLKEGEEPKEVAVIAGCRGLAFDPDGRLLAVTTIEDPIRRVGEGGKLEVLVKGRPFEFPHQIVVGKDGTMYVTDNYAATVWQVPAAGGEPKPFVKGAPLVKPVGLAKRGDDLLVADPHAKAIFVVTPDAKITPLLPPQ
jgi:sugar lactone lactonase YvrE